MIGRFELREEVLVKLNRVGHARYLPKEFNKVHLKAATTVFHSLFRDL